MSATDPPAPGPPSPDRDGPTDVLGQVGFVMLVPPLLQPLVRALFRPERFGPGDVIIHQGAPSDALYVVAHGRVDVVKDAGGGEVPLGSLQVGAVFGEVGLLNRTERMATVRAAGPVEVLRLGRDGFEALLAVHPEVAGALAGQVRLSRINTLLRDHPAFSLLPLDVLVASLDGFEPVELAMGDRIVDADGVDDALYIVESGRLRMQAGADDGSPVAGELVPGDFFGEEAVLAGTPRVGQVEALEPSRLFRLDVAAFSELVQRAPAFAQAMLDRARNRGTAATAKPTGARAAAGPRGGVQPIQIDQERRAQATAEITQTEFFQSLASRAENLRTRLRQGGG